MPSMKPRLATYTTQEVIQKFNFISNFENRTMSKELEFLVKEYIRKFEQANGKITEEMLKQIRQETEEQYN